MASDYHQRKAITFRPETEDDERWLNDLAQRSGRSMNAVMKRIVSEARTAHVTVVVASGAGGGGGGAGGGGRNSASGATGSGSAG
jgi:hypothetical protein